MKTYFTLLLAYGFCMISQAQTIDQIIISPTNPTTNDEITFTANCYFSSGTCDQKTQIMSINGNEISASAMHCLGMLTYICNNVDSFYIGYLPAGNYQLTFSLDAGYGPVPCTPGIVAGPTDTVTFTVQTFTGITENESKRLLISPNPTSGFVNFKIDSNDFTGKIEIRDITGILQQTIVTLERDVFINMNDLPEGIYSITFIGSNGRIETGRVIKSR